MMEERYHATTKNRFYPDVSNVNKNITVVANLISPPTYITIPSFTLHFLQNSPFVQLYTSISNHKGVGKHSWKPFKKKILSISFVAFLIMSVASHKPSLQC